MAYSIKPAVFGSMFGVPTATMDYIKLASPCQLKTMLWIFSNAAKPIDPENIGNDIGYRSADVNDALVALCEWGLLACDNKEIVVMEKPEKAEAQVQTKAKKELPDLVAVKPTNEQVVKRCQESPQIANMFLDLQGVLGETIGYDRQCTLLMMHDQYGLPVEVIYMLVNYCVSIGKRGFSYIAKVGKDWGEKEIDTIEKADEQIKILNTCSGVWKEFAAMAGIQNPRPNAAQSAFLRTWTQEMKFNAEMIYMAYEEMANHTSRISFPYMNKILVTWYEKGIKTPEDIERDKQEYKKANDTKKSNDGNSSYNMDEFMRRADKLPVYKKGE